MNPFRCTICQEDSEKHEVPLVLECNHRFHFNCVYDLVIKGRIYDCPNCRHGFTGHWIENHEQRIMARATELDEVSVVNFRLSFLRSTHQRENHRQMETPPPLAPVEDADGNWVIPMGPDINVLDLLLESDMNIMPPREPGSLIPNRRAARRNRMARNQPQVQNPTDADTESTDNSSNDN